MVARAPALLVTCEHGGNRIPAPYQHLFETHRDLLDSHRGYDAGALLMARVLARTLAAPLLAATVSRLLVDLNRSIGHRNLHWDGIRSLPATLHQEINQRYYQPYRLEAERLVRQGIAAHSKLIHISCHSFTNTWGGRERGADIGLLYDPAREGELAFCAEWKAALKSTDPTLQVRRNFPYRGRGDGLTSTLRKGYPAHAYLGIELELNQKHLLLPATKWTALRRSIITSLDQVLGSCAP